MEVSRRLRTAVAVKGRRELARLRDGSMARAKRVLLVAYGYTAHERASPLFV